MTPLGEAERVNDAVLFGLGMMGFKTESSPKYRQNLPTAMSHPRVGLRRMTFLLQSSLLFIELFAML